MALTRIDSYLLDLDAIGGIDFDVQNGTPTLKVDETTHRVGVGNNAPAVKFDVRGTADAPTLTWNGSGQTIIGDTANQLSIGRANSSPFGLYFQARASNNAARDILLNPVGGDVGIGTDNPSAALEVQRATDLSVFINTTGTSTSARCELISGDGTTSGGYSYVRFNNNDTNNQRYAIGTYGDNNFQIRDEKVNSVRLLIKPDGNVGIGTDNPNSKIQLVAGNSVAADNGNIVTISSGDGTSGNLVNKLNFGVSSTNNYAWIQSVKPGTNVYPLLLNPLGGSIGIGTDDPDGALNVYSTNPTRVVIEGDGQSTAAAALVIKSNDADSNYRATGVFYYDATSQTEWFSGRPYTGSDTFAIHRKTSLGGSTGNTTAHPDNSLFVVNSSGNVGVGNTTPAAKLEVSGDAIFTQTSATIQNDCLQIGFTAPNGFIKSKNSSGSPASNLDFYSTDTSGNTNLGIRLQYTGKVFIGSTTEYGPSEQQLSNKGLIVTSDGENSLKIVDTTAYAANVGASIVLGGNYRSSGDTQAFVRLKSFKENATDANYAYGFSVSTTPNSGSLTERLRITSGGNIKFAENNSTTDYLQWGSNPRLFLQTPTGINGLRIYSDTTPIEIGTNATSRKISIGGGPNHDISISGSYSLSAGGYDSSPKVFLNATRHNGSTTVTSFQTAIQAVSSSNTSGDGYLGLGASAVPNDLVIRPSGNVGIGNTNPGTNLDIAGNIRLSAADAQIQLNDGGPRLRAPIANTLTIHTGGTLGTDDYERLRITSDGQLENTATAATSSTTSNAYPALRFRNPQASYTADNFVGGITFGKASGNGNGIRAGILGRYDSTGSVAGNVGMYLSFYTSAESAGDGNEKLRITSSGNVGIGTDTVGAKLHIYPGASSDTIPGLKIARDWGSVSGHMVQFDGNPTSAGDGNVLLVKGGGTRSDTETFEVRNGSGTTFVVKGSGNVGIGTTDPVNKLTVGTNPNSYSSYAFIHNPTGADSTTRAELSNNAALTIQPHATNSTHMSIGQVNSGGGMGIQVTNYDKTADWDICLNPFGGNVGVNTTAPRGTLDVVGDVVTSSYRVGVMDRWKIRGNNSNQELCFEYATSSTLSDANIKARFDANGNFGIGVNPQSKLDVEGLAKLGGGNEVSIGYAPSYSSGFYYDNISTDNHATFTIGLNAICDFTSSSGNFNLRQTQTHSSIGLAAMHMPGNGSSLVNNILFYSVAGPATVGNTVSQGGWELRIHPSGVEVAGSFSKGSGSFKIDHPLPEKSETHNLVHSFVESPQANNIYRGKVTLANGSASINLDEVSGMTEGTFVLLNRDIHCFTSNESDWDAVRGSVNGNILTIECQNPSSIATVAWLVIGERHDQHMYDTEWTDENGKVIVEPLK